MNTLLFLCTGNYYRSRFAEFYFRHLAAQYRLAWNVDSRGLQLHPGNEGPLSRHTLEACRRLGISVEPLRSPISLSEQDLRRAQLTIAVKQTEHRPLMRQHFPTWEERVEYWEIHDLDVAAPDEALPELQRHVEMLFDRLRQTAIDGAVGDDYHSLGSGSERS